MAFTPSAGLNCIVAFDSAGTSPIAGMNWTIDVDPRAKDVSNFVTGRARIPTLADATLTFQLVWDLASPPANNVLPATGPGSLWAGNYVTIYAFVDKAHTKTFTFAGLITKVTPSIASIEDALLYNVEVSLSQPGSGVTFVQPTQLTYPAT